jgi:hypothetical protein
MNIINNRFSKLSCDEIRKEKKELEKEIKKRQDKRIEEINLEYKEKERILRSRFDVLASELGCIIPTEFKLTSCTRDILLDMFYGIGSRYYHGMYGLSDLSEHIDVDIINIMLNLSKEKEYNLLLYLAREVELNNLEYSRLSDISKVKEDI